MAVIYIDNLEVTLDAPVAADAEVLYPDASAAAQIAEGMGFSPYTQPEVLGPLFMRVPLFLAHGEQRELVYATHVQYGAVHILRTSGLAFPLGAVLRCAPPAETIAAGHLLSREVFDGNVIASPGEQTVLVTEEANIQIKTWMGPRFKGDDWPAEIVIQAAGITGARNVTFVKYVPSYAAWMGQEVSLAGAAARQSVLVIPADCRVAVLTLRRPPPAARDFSVQFMLTAQFFVA